MSNIDWSAFKVIANTPSPLGEDINEVMVQNIHRFTEARERVLERYIDLTRDNPQDYTIVECRTAVADPAEWVHKILAVHKDYHFISFLPMWVPPFAGANSAGGVAALFKVRA